jgi:hypothetical protein
MAMHVQIAVLAVVMGAACSDSHGTVPEPIVGDNVPGTESGCEVVGAATNRVRVWFDVRDQTMFVLLDPAMAAADGTVAAEAWMGERQRADETRTEFYERVMEHGLHTRDARLAFEIRAIPERSMSEVDIAGDVAFEGEAQPVRVSIEGLLLGPGQCSR